VPVHQGENITLPIKQGLHGNGEKACLLKATSA